VRSSAPTAPRGDYGTEPAPWRRRGNAATYRSRDRRSGRAEKKEDLSAKVAHKPIEDWGKQSSGKKDDKKDEESGETDASKSPFLNRNRGAAATEDE
jgi:hypothetical protein